MTNLQLLKQVKKNLTLKRFNSSNYNINYPHCVIGEVNRIAKVRLKNLNTFNLSYKLFGKLGSKDFEILNNPNVTFKEAHKVIDRAIKRFSKKHAT